MTPKQIGKEMKVAKNIKSVVFTTPYKPLYQKQALDVIRMISKKFPDAQKICSMHAGLDTIKTDRNIADYAQELGFEIRDVSSDVQKIHFYQSCDLHIGYRCHGHIMFLRNRIPSILINEDGRGRGIYQYVWGGGELTASKESR